MVPNAIVIMNERHTLIKEQKTIFNLQFRTWGVKYIEDEQWSDEYFKNLQKGLEEIKVKNIAFVSPCSLLIARMVWQSCNHLSNGVPYPLIWILHATNRVEKTFGSSVKLIPDANSYILVPIL